MVERDSEAIIHFVVDRDINLGISFFLRRENIPAGSQHLWIDV